MFGLFSFTLFRRTHKPLYSLQKTGHAISAYSCSNLGTHETSLETALSGLRLSLLSLLFSNGRFRFHPLRVLRGLGFSWIQTVFFFRPKQTSIGTNVKNDCRDRKKRRKKNNLWTSSHMTVTSPPYIESRAVRSTRKRYARDRYGRGKTCATNCSVFRNGPYVR